MLYEYNVYTKRSGGVNRVGNVYRSSKLAAANWGLIETLLGAEPDASADCAPRCIGQPQRAVPTYYQKSVGMA